MLSNVIGFIWLIAGIFWLIKPASLRNRLSRKMSKRIRRTVLFFMLLFAFTMIGNALTASGLVAKLAGIVGVVLAVKVVLALVSRSTEFMSRWWAARPIMIFRAAAGGMALLGAVMIWG